MCEVHKTSHELTIAHGCALTVLTDWVRVRQQKMPDFQSVAAGAFGRVHERYDLIATHLPAGTLLVPEANRDLLLSDIGIAIGLHGAEDLLVTSDESSLRFLELARNRGAVRFPDGLRVRIRRTESVEAGCVPVVIACMDWRLHGGSKLAEILRKRFGLDDFYLMTVPGVGKDLTDASSARFSLVAKQLAEQVSRTRSGFKLLLLGHTDCGKYGGRQAFADATAELEQLNKDLTQASRNLTSAIPSLFAQTAVVSLSGNFPGDIV